MKIGVVDVGGGLRGIYAAGALDYCMDQGIRKRYPAAAEKLCKRAQRYNECVALAQKYARQGKVQIIAPDETCGVDTLKKDKESLQRLYDKGYLDGKKIADYLSNISV